MDLTWTGLFGAKYLAGVVGGFLLMIGAAIEPSVGVWVISLGGSLLTVALGKDQSLKEIAIHMLIGLFFGIFGSQIIHAWWPVIPQIAGSFFISMFGVNTAQYVFRNLDTTSFTDVVATVLEKLIPWKSSKK
jgi:hypothetical protein